MGKFDLDLRHAEEQLEEAGGRGQVVLGVLDGTTRDEEWIHLVETGNVLVLSVQGDLNKLAAGFARDVKDMDGQLMHFRDFLIITPPGITINTNRL